MAKWKSVFARVTTEKAFDGGGLEKHFYIEVLLPNGVRLTDDIRVPIAIVEIPGAYQTILDEMVDSLDTNAEAFRSNKNTP